MIKIVFHFGIRPTLKVSKKNLKLLNDFADRFDILNQKLDNWVSKKIRKHTDYYIEEDKDTLTFSEGGYGEHSVFFSKFILLLPAEKIAQTFAKAAKIFSYEDKMFEKTCKYVDTVNAKKHPKIVNSENFEDNIWMVYKKHIVLAIREEFNKDKQFELTKKIDI